MIDKLMHFLGVRKEVQPIQAEWWEEDFLLGNPFSVDDIEAIQEGRGIMPKGVLNGKLPLIGRDPTDRNWVCQIKECSRPSQFDIITIAELDIDVPYLRDRNRTEGIQVIPSYHWYHLCDNCLHDYYQSGKPGPVLVQGDDRARQIYDSATGDEVK